MTDARARILARLQSSRREAVAEQSPAGPGTTGTAAMTEMLERFTRGLEKVFATHETVTTEAQISKAIERYLNQLDAGDELVVAPAVSKAGLLDNSSLQQRLAPTRGNEKNAVTLAYAGIAETGSLVMLSAADTPMTTNFLPDNFICVLKTRDVLNDMEALWSRMASEQRTMPRCLSLITGPSRTADVEQIIQMGAHGERRVHVILWANST